MPVLTSDPAAESGGCPEVRIQPPSCTDAPPRPLQLEHLHRRPCCPCPEAPWELFSKTHQNKSPCPSNSHTAVNQARRHCLRVYTVDDGAPPPRPHTAVNLEQQVEKMTSKRRSEVRVGHRAGRWDALSFKTSSRTETGSITSYDEHHLHIATEA